eukprot:TRINITY_DN20144_c0_g1_i2.p1 TRINITY_DN20144_c0_g1~~TRINITY_DN20144_c0_g1_i2.p1  ORF type:complete len:812 (-),score=156.00 TRINITY_DN20144_c0_g1_i2:455-2890(-)
MVSVCCLLVFAYGGLPNVAVKKLASERVASAASYLGRSTKTDAASIASSTATGRSGAGHDPRSIGGAVLKARRTLMAGKADPSLDGACDKDVTKALRAANESLSDGEARRLWRRLESTVGEAFKSNAQKAQVAFEQAVRVGEGDTPWAPRVAAALALRTLGLNKAAVEGLLSHPAPMPRVVAETLVHFCLTNKIEFSLGEVIVDRIEWERVGRAAACGQSMSENGDGTCYADEAVRTSEERVPNSIVVPLANWFMSRDMTNHAGGWQVRALNRASRLYDSVFAAVVADPSSDPFMHLNYSAALIQCRRYSKARAVLEAVLTKPTMRDHPGRLRGIVNLIMVLVQDGDADRAETVGKEHWVELAGRTSPRDVRFEFLIFALRLRDLTLVRRTTEAWQAWLAAGTLQKDEATNVLFKLTKAYVRLGAVDEAVAAAKKGNDLVHTEVANEPLDTLAKIMSMSRWRARELGPTLQQIRPTRRVRLAMIVGAPRSGTSLLENVLSAAWGNAGNGSVHALGESPMFYEAAARAEADLGADYLNKLAQNDVALKRHQNSLEAELERLVEEARQSAAYLRGEETKTEDTTKFRKEVWKGKIDDQTTVDNQVPYLLVTKWPLDFNHVALAALLLGGNLRVVHCRRDARDTAFSIYMERFKQSSTFLWSFHIDGISKFFEGYLSVMEQLRSSLAAGLLREVWYEDVVRNFDGSIEALSEFLGLSWDDEQARQSRNFHQLRREVLTASRDQVRQPLYGTSVGRWKYTQDTDLRRLFSKLQALPGALVPNNSTLMGRQSAVTTEKHAEKHALKPERKWRKHNG